MTTLKKIISLVLVFILIAGILAGCGKQSLQQPSSDNTTETGANTPNTDVNFSSENVSRAQNDNFETPIITDESAPSLPKDSPETPSVAEKAEDLDALQINSIAMLNYLTVLTQEISSSSGSRLYLEEAYSSLINNTFPNSVNTWTESEIEDLLDVLEDFRMISVKRDRLQYIYEHNKAQSLRSAIPNPVSILNAVQSGDSLKIALSVLYIAVDSYSSYAAFNEQNDLQYLQDGWALDDEEAAKLHGMRRNTFSYMLNMVREYNLPGDLALNEAAVEDFVEWKNKTNVVSRIHILEQNESTYEALGAYWLILAQSYYENGDYSKCIDAIEKHNSITSRIVRKNYDYANTLPYAILSAQEVYKDDNAKYIDYASRCAEVILKNTDPDDWSSCYFVALVYMDLYGKSGDATFLDSAYKIALNNVTYLVDEQNSLNETWLNDIVEIKPSSDANDQEKKDTKQYNKMLKENRKTELPPICEPLFLNCNLLFALAEEKNISSTEKQKIDSILHENGDNLFLVAPIDNEFRFLSENAYPSISDALVEFDGKKITLPAYLISDNFQINVTIMKDNTSVNYTDWTVVDVDRPKNATDVDFTVTLASKLIKKYDYSNGEQVIITITPKSEEKDVVLTVSFNAKQGGWLFPWNPVQEITFERVQ